jgi:hypothetical protein
MKTEMWVGMGLTFIAGSCAMLSNDPFLAFAIISMVFWHKLIA